MHAFLFAWRSLIRQPARAALGVLGVAAVGALLFDMLLLSHGLVTSLQDLLDRSGYDVRVGVADRPGGGPEMPEAAKNAARIAALPDVKSVITVRFVDTDMTAGPATLLVPLQGVGGNGPRPWTVMRGDEPAGDRPALLVNDYTADQLHLAPGGTVTVRPSCGDANASLPPVRFRVSGIAQFPFETAGSANAGTTADMLARACGDRGPAGANIILATSNGNSDAAAAAITALDPELRALTNSEAVSRMEAGGFSYFSQISTVLTTVTVGFALLLITVLLTVSVNQRLGAIAALRALGFSRRRVVADVLCESALIVGLGGVLSLPLGLVMATWLDRILKQIPGIPAALHFFVFEWRALVIQLALLVVTAVVAALYPMRIVASLPIATTLRNEVVS